MPQTKSSSPFVRALNPCSTIPLAPLGARFNLKTRRFEFALRQRNGHDLFERDDIPGRKSGGVK